jgi:hypothetical protein
MKFTKRIFRFLRILLFAFMFAVCLVLGIVPIIPKRKEESADEVTIKETGLKDDAGQTVLFNADRK